MQLHRGELIPASYVCAWCGEKNDIVIDPSQGREQQMVEDCQICCRPNVLYIYRDPATGKYLVKPERES